MISIVFKTQMIINERVKLTCILAHSIISIVSHVHAQLVGGSKIMSQAMVMMKCPVVYSNHTLLCFFSTYFLPH